MSKYGATPGAKCVKGSRVGSLTHIPGFGFFKNGTRPFPDQLNAMKELGIPLVHCDELKGQDPEAYAPLPTNDEVNPLVQEHRDLIVYGGLGEPGYQANPEVENSDNASPLEA